VSAQKAVCQELQFTDDVYPVYEQDWNAYVRDWLQTHELEGNLVILTEGPSRSNPQTNNRMEIIDLARTK
jgi:pyruvate kinase